MTEQRFEEVKVNVGTPEVKSESQWSQYKQR